VVRAGRSETDKQERQPRPPPLRPARAARRHRCVSTCRGGGGAPARRGTGGDGGAAVGTVSARPLHRPRGRRSRAPGGCWRLRNGSPTWRGDGGAASPTLSVNATGIIPMMGRGALRAPSPFFSGMICRTSPRAPDPPPPRVQTVRATTLGATVRVSGAAAALPALTTTDRCSPRPRPWGAQRSCQNHPHRK